MAIELLHTYAYYLEVYAFGAVYTLRQRLHDTVFAKFVLNPFSICFPSARIWSVYMTLFLQHSNTHNT